MKKMIFLAMSCISTLMVTNTIAMFTSRFLRQPAQRFTITPGRTRAFSTVTTQSRALNNAEEALKGLKQYQEDFTTSRKLTADDLNQRSWFSLPQRRRSESALVENLSEIESKFAQALEDLKKELVQKDQEIARLKVDSEEYDKKLREELNKRIVAEKALEENREADSKIRLGNLYPWKYEGYQTVKE